ncbi:uncharacterized protein LOC117010411 isoform X2 [Catharus ustulatus]|uniref:uncharacterized protein LOC117010411 isoform X2 n=1 Tax=Catharus ustulatus TaxID=91951 RepID=UPI00140D2ED9|nr:uncharacterized protein LOC117010411 isoform X2 [Catharus ustulatus]
MSRKCSAYPHPPRAPAERLCLTRRFARLTRKGELVLPVMRGGCEAGRREYITRIFFPFPFFRLLFSFRPPKARSGAVSPWDGPSCSAEGSATLAVLARPKHWPSSPHGGTQPGPERLLAGTTQSSHPRRLCGGTLSSHLSCLFLCVLETSFVSPHAAPLPALQCRTGTNPSQQDVPSCVPLLVVKTENT